MNIHKNMNPAFMQEVDRFLLCNHPVMWTLRIHYVAALGSLCSGLILVLGWLYPWRLSDIQRIQQLRTFLIVFSILGFLGWHIWLSKCSVEKQFRRTSVGLAFWRWIGYCACTMMLLLPQFLFVYATVHVLQSQITRRELENDGLILEIVEAVNEDNSPWRDYARNQYQQEFDHWASMRDSAERVRGTLVAKYAGADTLNAGREYYSGINVATAQRRNSSLRGLLGFGSGLSGYEVACLFVLYGCSLSLIAFTLTMSSSGLRHEQSWVSA